MDDSIYILFLCVVLNSGVCSSRKYAPIKPAFDEFAIVGGRNTTIQEHPYQAYLLIGRHNGYLYECAGSIISPKAILTAAHCLNDAMEVFVRIGSTHRDTGTEYRAIGFLQHPQFNPGNYDYDVGIVKLSQDMVLDGINTKVIALADEGTSVSGNVNVAGWGLTSENGKSSKTLLEVTLPVVPDDECNNLIQGVTDRMFCAGYLQGGIDSCKGDSGSPAVGDDGIQRGITSWSTGCAKPDTPAAYTKISHDKIREWIKMETGV